MNSLSCIEKLNKKWQERKRKKKKCVINAWIVLEGRSIYSCRTRGQARKFAKGCKKAEQRNFIYVGKVLDKNHKIILDV